MTSRDTPTTLHPALDQGAGPPPIPMALQHLSTVAGLVVPWITARRTDGRVLFGAVDHHRLHTCLRERRCGVCGQALQDRLVLMMRLSDLPLRCTSEPPLHPWCAAYSRTACPMLHGRMRHYRASPPAADDTTLPAPDTAARLGAAAEPWFSVWITDYALVTHHGTPAAAYRDDQVVRIRPVTGGPAGSPG